MAILCTHATVRAIDPLTINNIDQYLPRLCPAVSGSCASTRNTPFCAPRTGESLPRPRCHIGGYLRASSLVRQLQGAWARLLAVGDQDWAAGQGGRPSGESSLQLLRG